MNVGINKGFEMKILIDTDWFSAIQDLQPSKQKEVLMAILNYPNGDSDTNLWKKTILPNLEKGKISYFNKLQNLKQNKPQKSNKKNPDSVSDSDIGSVTEPNTDTTIREDKEKNNNKNNINIYTRFNAGFQNWKFEPTLLAVAKKYWTADTIRKIEIDFSCQEYNTETSIQELLERCPADKDKAVLPKNLGQYEYMRQQMQKWIDYKKSRGEKYKTEQSLMVCAKKLHELSGGNALDADAIIEQSIANNYAGLFPLKNAQQKRKPNINLYACEDNFLDDTPYWLKNKKD